VDISLTRGTDEGECMTNCMSAGCTDTEGANTCANICRRVASAAMDAGQAVCMNSTSPTSSGEGFTPLEKRGLSPGVIVGIIIYFCCCCCTSVLTRRKAGSAEEGVGANM